MVRLFSRLARFSLALSLCGLPAAFLIAQDDPEAEATRPLDQVRRISELSGRPIFAVAGQST